MRGLRGRQVLITRAADDADDWARALTAAGAEPQVFACIESALIDTPAVRARLAAELPAADWIVLSSRRGVMALEALLPTADRARCFANARFAAVGPATGRALEASIGRVDLVSKGGHAAALAAELAALLDGQRARIVLVVAENAAATLEDRLTAAGAECRRIDVYRTLPARAAEPRPALSTLGAECILLASPSAVTGLVQCLELDRPVEIYTLGPSTTAAAEAHGLTVTAQAREPTLQGLMEIMQCTNE